MEGKLLEVSVSKGVVDKLAKDKTRKVEDVVQVFKRPSSPSSLTPKKKRKVLSEDKFADALEKIIQRECFPDLEKLKAQNAYLDAVANNDIQMMRELHAKYVTGRNTPLRLGEANETPTTFETPSSTGLLSSRRKDGLEPTPTIIHGEIPLPGDASISSSSNKDDDDSDAKSVISEACTTVSSKTGRRPHELGLNEFLNTYTSEDNQSFQEIIDEGIRKHKIKYAWLYQAEEEHGEKMRRALELPSATQQQSLEYQRPNEVETWSYKNKNAVMYVPEGAPYTGKELVELAKKQTAVEFKNTRFVGKAFKKPSTEIVVGQGQGNQTPNTASAAAAAAAAAGKALNLIQGVTVGKIGVDGKEVNSMTPSVNGFKYVRTPSPTPGGSETPFLTWGEIEGTPFRLDASDTPMPSSAAGSTPYKMMETSHRERLALELAEKASQRYRDKKQKTIEVAKSYLTTPSPRPKTNSERMNSMTPAAQRFANRILKRPDTGTPRT